VNGYQSRNPLAISNSTPAATVFFTFKKDAGNLNFNTIVADATYNVWLAIDNSTDTYKIYMQSNNDPALSSITQLLKSTDGLGTFTFRNSGSALQANDLISFNMGVGGGGFVGPVFIDDIYVDTGSANLANPVPEPATLTTLALGTLAIGALALLRRRR